MSVADRREHKNGPDLHRRGRVLIVNLKSNTMKTQCKNMDNFCNHQRFLCFLAEMLGGKMQWTALRENEDGSTFQQIMDWVKIEED